MKSDDISVGEVFEATEEKLLEDGFHAVECSQCHERFLTDSSSELCVWCTFGKERPPSSNKVH